VSEVAWEKGNGVREVSCLVFAEGDQALRNAYEMQRKYDHSGPKRYDLR
jgi:hypothetical protein